MAGPDIPHGALPPFETSPETSFEAGDSPEDFGEREAPDRAEAPTDPRAGAAYPVLPPHPGQEPPPDAPIGASSPPMAPPMAPRVARRTSHRRLWITLGVLLVVLAGGGAGAAIAYRQYTAPANAVIAFCGDLKAQNYAGAYGLLSATLRAAATRDQFAQAAATLDTLEGKATACGQAKAGNAYNYHLGGHRATVLVMIARPKAASLQGTIHLVNEGNAWKVDGLDTPLLGANLGALQATGAFCRALTAQDYAAAYALLTSEARAGVAQAAYTQAAQLHDQIDGKISACAAIALGTGNTDTATSLTLSVTRARLGERHDALGLVVAGGAWKIGTVGPQLQGSNLGGLAVASRFCEDITARNYADAYGLQSANARGNFSEDQFAAGFNGAADGLPILSCTAAIATYTVSGSSATMQVTFVERLPSGAQVSFAAILKLALSGATWQVDGLGVA